MTYAIELKQIGKRYKDTVALDDLSMQVPSGKVYGFLGRNGAGKTTTIRIITGLVKQNTGSVSVMSRDARKNRLFVLENIGAIVESPGFYRNLSGKQNLQITADLYGIGKARVDEVLGIVGMAEYGDRKVRGYSTGMRQRLGIANALIHSPNILILDEPTNGLDPKGVKDLRRLIKELSEKLDITILLSSHILSEVEQIADYVGILDKGRLVDQFSMADFRSADQNYLLLEVDLPEKAEPLLRKHNIRFSLSGHQIKVYCPKAKNAEISKLMASDQIVISNMSSVEKSLEDRFLSAVGDDE